MYEDQLQNLQNLATRLTVILEEAEKQDVKEIVKECKLHLSQLQTEILRIRKMRSYKKS